MRSPDACVSLSGLSVRWRPAHRSLPARRLKARCKAGVARRGFDQIGGVQTTSCVRSGRFFGGALHLRTLAARRAYSAGWFRRIAIAGKQVLVHRLVHALVRLKATGVRRHDNLLARLAASVQLEAARQRYAPDQSGRQSGQGSIVHLRLTFPSSGRPKVSGFAPLLMSNVRPNSNLWIFPNVALGSHLSPVPPTSPFRRLFRTASW